jgi:hypothetical protein
MVRLTRLAGLVCGIGQIRVVRMPDQIRVVRMPGVMIDGGRRVVSGRPGHRVVAGATAVHQSPLGTCEGQPAHEERSERSTGHGQAHCE